MNGFEFDRDALIILNCSLVVSFLNILFICSVFIYFCCCVVDVVSLDHDKCDHLASLMVIEETHMNDEINNQAFFNLFESNV